MNRRNQPTEPVVEVVNDASIVLRREEEHRLDNAKRIVSVGEVRSRGERESSDEFGAITVRVDGGRSAGCVITESGFGLHHSDRRAWGDGGGTGHPGNASPDDGDLNVHPNTLVPAHRCWVTECLHGGPRYPRTDRVGA